MTGAAEPRPNQRKQNKAKTRNRVLTAARELFETEDYADVTTRAIAARAGMSTGAIYASVRDKAALYAEIFGHPPLTPRQARDLLTAAYAVSAIRPGNWADVDHDPRLYAAYSALDRALVGLPQEAPAVWEMGQDDVVRGLS